MGRYTGKAVTSPNDFVASTESNTVDPNSDNNPLLDNNDPADNEAGNRDHGDDFQVAGEDLVEVKNVPESEVTTEGEVLNKINEIDNIAKEGQEQADVVEALAAVSCEMHAIIASRGFLTAGEAMVTRSLIDTLDACMPAFAKVQTAMPSMEDFKEPGLAYSNATVSLESIGERVDSAFNTLGLNLERLFKNGVGLANSLTPLFTSQITRAQAIKAGLNSAHRDAGQKTVSGKFVKNLAIEGQAPEANTVLKTAQYLGQITDQVMSYTALDTARDNVQNAMAAVKNGIDLKDVKKTGLIAKLIVLFGGSNPVTFLTEIGVRDTIYSQLSFDGQYTIDMFGLYSSIARVQTGSDAAHLEAKKSLPLFGDVELKVTDYKKNFSTKINHSAVPSISFVKNKSQSGATEMQALTSQQQAQTADAALKILIAGRNYYKDYATRNKRAMEVFKSAFTMQQQTTRDNISVDRRFENMYVANAYNYYSRLYWRGIFVDQSKVATYLRKTAKSLLDLVEASSVGSQGGAPSTESYSDFV